MQVYQNFTTRFLSMSSSYKFLVPETWVCVTPVLQQIDVKCVERIFYLTQHAEQLVVHVIDLSKSIINDCKSCYVIKPYIRTSE